VRDIPGGILDLDINAIVNAGNETRSYQFNSWEEPSVTNWDGIVPVLWMCFFARCLLAID